MIAQEIAQAVLDGVPLASLPGVEKRIVKSFIPQGEYYLFWSTSLVQEWTFMLLVAHALGYEDPYTMEDHFQLTDPDLDTLVNLAVNMTRGRGNMDIAIMWTQALDNLNARLGVCQEKRNG